MTRFPFRHDPRARRMMPLLELGLERAGGNHLSALALLDTGSPINVMPRAIGESLGFNWRDAESLFVLGGALHRLETRGILVIATVPAFEPIQLAFAWAEDDRAPLILGQTDFFTHFRVCFNAADEIFELRLTSDTPLP